MRLLVYRCVSVYRHRSSVILSRGRRVVKIGVRSVCFQWLLNNEEVGCRDFLSLSAHFVVYDVSPMVIGLVSTVRVELILNARPTTEFLLSGPEKPVI